LPLSWLSRFSEIPFRGNRYVNPNYEFTTHKRDLERALARGGGQAPLSLDYLDAETNIGFQPAEEQTPKKACAKRWALALLKQSLSRLRQEYSERGRRKIFELLKPTLTQGRGSLAYAELAF
jgi:RNA polymerase sigma-70 factor (ECF subfamily)